MVIVLVFLISSLASRGIMSSSIFDKSLQHASFAMNQAYHELVHRSKRDFLDFLPNIIQCSANCVLPLVSVMIQEHFGTPSGFAQLAQIRQEMGLFYEICKVYQNASDCATSCRSETFKETISQMTTVPRFVCIERYHDFQRHLPCLSQVTNDSETQCATQCAHYDTLMSQINASKVFNKPGGEVFTDLIRQSCEYSACNIDCQRQMVSNRCGVDAQRLVQDMVQLSVNSVEQLSDTVGFPFAMPSECRRLDIAAVATTTTPSGETPGVGFPFVGGSGNSITYGPNSVVQQPPPLQQGGLGGLGQTYFQHNQRYHQSQTYHAPAVANQQQKDYWQMRAYHSVQHYPTNQQRENTNHIDYGNIYNKKPAYVQSSGNKR